MISQGEFLSAILDAKHPAPEGLLGPSGQPAGKRFDVYRNNVAVSLTEALQTGFPVVHKLVGGAFFDAMAGVFLRAHPPDSPVLSRYGDALPDFLESFPPAASLPYLPDVARLELALRLAYHAADTAPFDPETLTRLSPDRLMSTALSFAPAVQLIASSWPIHGIWRANTDPDAPAPRACAETVLLTRPEYAPVVTALDSADAAFVSALLASDSLGHATEVATETDPAFDLSNILGLLLSQQAITAVKERPAP